MNDQAKKEIRDKLKDISLRDLINLILTEDRVLVKKLYIDYACEKFDEEHN
jgi:hypothetical protein